MSEEQIGRHQIFNIVTTFVGFVTLGLCGTVLGPSLVHLEYMLQTSTDKIAYSFTGFSIGYGLGAFLCGIIFDRVQRELMLSLAQLLLGITTFIMALMPDLYSFVAAVTIQSAFQGLFEPSADAYVISQCGDSQAKKPVLTGVHAVTSLGAALAPVILQPFLVELPKENQDNFTISTVNQSFNGTSRNFYNSLFTKPSNSSGSDTNGLVDGIYRIRYAYAIIGLFCVIPSSMYLFSCIVTECYSSKDMKDKDINEENKTDNKTQEQQEELATLEDKKDPEHEAGTIDKGEEDKVNISLEDIHTKLTTQGLKLILALMVISYFVHEWYTGVSLGFLTTFAVKALNWDARKGALIMTVYWGAHSGSRFIGIIVSAFLSPTKMISLNFAIALIGFTLMAFVQFLPEFFMWFSAAVAAFGVSTTFTTMMLWLSDYTPITGRVSSAMFVGSSVGFAVATLAMGYLIELTTPMIFVYVSLTGCICHLVLFIFVLLMSKKFRKNDERKIGTDTEIAAISL